MSSKSSINTKANLIWEVATKLVGVYKPHEYGKVILPMTVLKRFDDIFEKTELLPEGRGSGFNVEEQVVYKLNTDLPSSDLINTEE